MPTNDFKPFATGAGANVMSQADWEALAALATGFQSGKASSAQVNKAIRQALFIASALAQYTADKSGQNVLDDGNVAGFIAKMSAAFGKDFQPLDATLTALAGLAGGANKLPYFTGVDALAQTDITSVGRDIIGQTSIANVLSYLTAAPLASPAFTGTPTTPSVALDLNTTQIANTAYVSTMRGPFRGVTGVTANSTLTLTVDYTDKVIMARGGAAITIPASATIVEKRAFTIVAVDSTPVTIALTSGDSATPTINGLTFPLTLQQGEQITLVSRGTSNAYIVVNYISKTLNSPVLTGTPTAPTAAAGTSTTQLATTEFVGAALIAATGRLKNIVTITASGTYTPSTGAKLIVVEGIGGGGGGGGAGSSSGTSSVGGGGGAGGRFIGMISTLAASYSVTVGTAGTAGVPGSTGGTGGDTVFSSFTAGGGGGGQSYNAAQSSSQGAGAGGAGGTATGGTINSRGAPGGLGFWINTSIGFSGIGASSTLGGGGRQAAYSLSSSSAGNGGLSYGAGGSGAICSNGATAVNGGAGAPGVIIIYEYY